MATYHLRRPTLIALALLAIASGAWLGSNLLREPLTTTGAATDAVTLFPAARSLPELTMIDQHGQPFNFIRIKGQWSLLFMGFTNCGHVCPMTMADLRTVHDLLPEPINVVFVSVDPDRDSPEVIRDFVQAFGPNIIGITGSMDELKRLAANLGAFMDVDASQDSYTVDHSSAVFLLDPSGALAGTITPPFKPVEIAAELSRIM